MSIDRPSHPRGSEDEDPVILDRLEELWEALEEGEVDEALDLAELLATDHPESGNAALGLAAARYEAGSITETLAAALRAGELGVEDRQLQEWYVAASHHYLWRFDLAREILERLLRDESDFAEAWYLLAQVCEMQGDEVGARRGYEQAFRLEPERFPRPVRLDEEDLDKVISKAREALPPRFREILDDLAVVVLEHPSFELASSEVHTEEPVPPDVLGLFIGSDRLDQSVFNPVDHPGVIFIFKRNLERVCPDRPSLIEEIRTTLYHELAHYLGFEEDQMADLGLD